MGSGEDLERVFSDIEESAVGYASESVFRNLSSHLAKDEIELGAVPRTRKQKLYSLRRPSPVSVQRPFRYDEYIETCLTSIPTSGNRKRDIRSTACT
jgi:hypothetical protein